MNIMWNMKWNWGFRNKIKIELGIFGIAMIEVGT